MTRRRSSFRQATRPARRSHPHGRHAWKVAGQYRRRTPRGRDRGELSTALGSGSDVGDTTPVGVPRRRLALGCNLEGMAPVGIRNPQIRRRTRSGGIEGELLAVGRPCGLGHTSLPGALGQLCQIGTVGTDCVEIAVRDEGDLRPVWCQDRGGDPTGGRDVNGRRAGARGVGQSDLRRRGVGDIDHLWIHRRRSPRHRTLPQQHGDEHHSHSERKQDAASDIHTKYLPWIRLVFLAFANCTLFVPRPT